MRLHYSLAHANAVLALVRRSLGRDFGGDRVLIECWANCREQGYCIHISPYEGKDMAICFAQTRGGDEMVTVAGPRCEFNNQTNHPTEEIWEKSRKFFKTDEKAAEYISGFIVGAMEPVIAKLMGAGE